MVKLEESLVIISKKSSSLTKVKEQPVEVFPIEEITLEDIVILLSNPALSKESELLDADLDNETIVTTEEEFLQYAETLAGLYKKKFIRDFVKFLSERAKTEKKKTINDYITEGTKKGSDKDYLGAIKCYDDALKIDEADKKTLNLKANVLVKLRRLSEAVGCYDKIITAHEDNLLAHLSKGNILLNLKKYDKAIEEYDLALKVDQFNEQAWVGKAEATLISSRNAWRKKKRVRLLEEAKDYADKAIEYNSLNEKAWLVKGEIYHDLKYTEESVKCYGAYGRILALKGKKVNLEWQKEKKTGIISL